jgi:hypothetical protein
LTNGTIYTYRAKAVGSTTVYGLDKTFTPGTSTKLIGADDATTGTNIGTNNAVWNKWAAISTGSVTQIRVKCNNSGNVKVAIYTDSSGNPGALLNAVNASTPVSAGWNNISITATPVISGISYWLAYVEDSGCVAYQLATGVPRKFSTGHTYSTFSWPSTAGTLMDAGPVYDAVAGWGN